MLGSKFVIYTTGLIASAVITSPAMAGVVCNIGEIRERTNVAIADAFSEQCWISCQTRFAEVIYNAPPGWAIIDYWTGTRHARGRTTSNLFHITAKSHYISASQFESLRDEARKVSGVDPNSGQPVEIGASAKAKTIENLHNAHQTSHTTVTLKVSATGREYRGGSSQRIEALHVKEKCIGTTDDYRAALRDELEAVNRKKLKTEHSTN